MTDKQHIELTVNLILVNAKLNALKLTLSDKDVDIYNNYILEQIKLFKPSLEKLLTREELEQVLQSFLK